MELQEYIAISGDIENDFKKKLAQLCEDFNANIVVSHGKMHVNIKNLKSHHSGHQEISFAFPLGAGYDMYQENLNS